MRRILLLAPVFAIVLPIAVARAQAPSPASPPAPQAPQAPSSQAMGGGPMHDGSMRGPGWMARGHEAPRPPGAMWGGPREAGPGWRTHGWMGHPPVMWHSQGAFFQFRRGRSSVTIKCAENESTEACVKAAISLMQEMHTLHQAAHPGANKQ